MSRHARRDFFKQLAAAGLGTTAWPALAQAQQPDASRGPDLVVINGVVYTIEEQKPKAEAFAVKDGRFVAVGGNAEIKALATSKTKVIDAAGMTVTPGFIDAHTHPAYSGI